MQIFLLRFCFVFCMGCFIWYGRSFITPCIQNYGHVLQSYAKSRSLGLVTENVLHDTEEKSPRIQEAIHAKNNLMQHKTPTADKLEIFNLTQEDIKALESLVSQRDTITSERKALQEERKNIQALTISLEKKMQDLQQIYKQLIAEVEMKSKEEQRSMASLIKIYEYMKPAQAAQVFMKMEPRKVVDFIENMKEAKASAILAELPPQLASYVTEQICQRRMIRDELQTRLDAKLSLAEKNNTTSKQAVV